MTLDVNRVKSPGRRLAAALLMAVAGFGLAGCGDDTSVSNSGGQTSNLNPRADLTGVVVDTNSQPVAGATIAVAGRTATTDASGVWVILDVAVVDTSSQDGSDPEVNGNLTIVVTPPSGYMGGIIEVYPQAEVVSSEAFFEENDDASSGETNPQLLLLDGYLVNTGTLALPKLAATVELLGIQQGSSGQPIPSGTPIALDFQRSDAGTIGANCIGGSFNNDEDNNGINFQPANVNFAGTIGANGNVTFTGLPENSCLNVVLQGWDFTNCGSEGLPDNEPEAPCSSGKAECTSKKIGGLKGIAKASNAGDICLITTNREVLPRTYVDMRAERLVASGDNVYPYLVSVTGVFNDVPAFDEDNVNLNLDDLFNGGRLIDGVNQTFVLNFSETLAPGLTEANVLVFNEDTQAYETVEDVSQSGNTVTVTLAEPQDPGTTLKFYLLLPQFRDLAGNPLLVGPNTSNVFDPIGYDFGSVDDICSTSCPAISYVGVRLCIYREPVVNPGSTVANQEEVDPRVTLEQNDAPINQARSVTFNDVRDQFGGVAGVTFFRIVQQINAPGEFEQVVEVMNDLGFAFGEDTDVDNDVPRIEFDPIDGVLSYRINVTQNGGVTTWTYDTGAGDFPFNNYSDDCESAPALFVEHCETASVLRDGELRYAFMYEGASEGDVVTIQALDDLNNPGALSNEVVIVDNVEPTVGVQRSYQDLHDYPAGVEDSADIANDSSDCYVRPDPSLDGAADDPNDTLHAGVKSIGGIDQIGSGGENTTPGAEAAVGDVCIGISPELIIDLADTDGNISTAHNELVAGRTEELDPAPYLPEAYDDEAFAAWDASDRTTNLGVAFTEPLASAGVPTFTGDAGLLGAFSVIGLTQAAPTINAIVRSDLEYLVRVPVSDALALANDNHNAVLGFVGATDTRGNAATAAAAPFLDIRDQWAPYIVDGERDENGDLTVTFNEAVVVEDCDRLSFDDGNPLTAGGDATVWLVADSTATPLCFGNASSEFTQSLDLLTITVESGELPAGLSVAFGNLELDGDPDVDENDNLQYDDEGEDEVPHALVDFRSIADVHGNSWSVYARSFADADPFTDDVPVFILPDLLGPFAISAEEGDAPNNIVAGATSFLFQLVGTHPICNIGQDTDFVDLDSCASDPAELFDVDGTFGCVGTLGSTTVSCAGSFVAEYISAGANCSVDAANSSASISADLQTISFNVDCAAAGALAAGDQVNVNGNAGNGGVGVSALDDTTDSALDPIVAEP